MLTVTKLILASIAIYLTIAAALILTNRPTHSTAAAEPLTFESLAAVSYDEMPPLQPYTARDGAQLHYRHYPSTADSDTLLILLHGSGWHSMQFHPLAQTLSHNGRAHVITPDLRGHGFTPAQRGDVNYIGQLEDDLADLIATLRPIYPNAQLIIGGHSSGGGLVIRFAGGEHGQLADGYLLLAPFLKYNAPTTRPNSGGWARPLSRRIAGLTMLNNIGIKSFNHLPVIQFNMPQTVLDSSLGRSATTSYSYRLNSSYAPRPNYGRDLTAMQQPFLLVAGLNDQSFIAEQYEPTISPYTQSGRYHLLPNTGHIDLLTHPELTPLITNWLTTKQIDQHN